MFKLDTKPPRASLGTWQLTELEVNGDSPIKFAGSVLSPEDLINGAAKDAGRSAGKLSFEWNGNTIEIAPGQGASSDDVYVTLNGDRPQKVTDPSHIHLNLSSMACCIGDACVMWPKKDPAAIPASGGGGMPLSSTQGSSFKIDTGGIGDGGGFPSAPISIGDFSSSGASPPAMNIAAEGSAAWHLHSIGVVNEAEKPLAASDHSSIDSAGLVQKANAGPAAAGAPLAFSWDGNLIEILPMHDGVHVALNGQRPGTRVSDPSKLHLDLSPMACCIGEACVMWPKPKLSTAEVTAALESAPLLGSSTGGGASPSAFELQVEAAPHFPLTLNGNATTPELVAEAASTAIPQGKEILLGYGPNTVRLVRRNNAGPAEVSLNGGAFETVDGTPAHLSLSKMACCVGEKCLMWPEPQKAEEKVVAAAVDLAMKADSPTDNSDAAFLRSIKQKLGEDDVRRLVQLLDRAGLEAATEPHSRTAQEHGGSLPDDSDTAATAAAVLEFFEDGQGEADESGHNVDASTGGVEHHGKLALCHSVAAFQDALEQSGADVAIVDLWATWCQPCLRVAPVFQAMADELAVEPGSSGSGPVFLKVDVQEVPDVMEHYQASALPTFLILRRNSTAGGGAKSGGTTMSDWSVVKRQEGDDMDALRALIREHTEEAKASTTNDISDEAAPALDASFAAKYPRATAMPTAGGKEAEQAVVMDSVKSKHVYDLVVVGGGSGGMAAAKKAAELGQSVALFDFVKPSTQGTTWGFGGTCVNVGCVPKKLMHYAAGLREHLLHDAEAFGTSVGAIRPHNWGKLVHTVQNHVKKLNYTYAKGVKNVGTSEDKASEEGEGAQSGNNTHAGLHSGIDLYAALARFEPGAAGDRRLSFVDGLGRHGVVAAKNVIIATGGRPFLPSDEATPGVVKHAISSDDLFSLNHSPGKTLVVGAGYIALECAGFLAGLGYPVSVAIRSIALRAFDRQCADKCVQSLALAGADLRYGTTIEAIRENNGSDVLSRSTVKGPAASDGGASAVARRVTMLEAHLNSSATQLPSQPRFIVTLKDAVTGENYDEAFDTILYGTGRAADTAGLNLGAVGIATNKRNGKIPAGENEEVIGGEGLEGIFVIGDASERALELTPVAIQAGELLACRLFAPHLGCGKMNYDMIATTVFTPAEYGCVGLSEEEALRRHGDKVEVFLTEFSSLEVGAAHRPLPAQFLCQLQRWPQEAGMQATSATTLYKGHELHVDDEAPPNSLAKVICVWEGPDDMELRNLACRVGSHAARHLRVVGFHFVGMNAGEITQPFALALRAGVTKADLDATVGIHPTDAEAFTSLETTRRSGQDWVSVGGCGGGKCG